MLAFGLMLFVSASTPCDSLKTLSTPQATVVGADVVPAGIFTPPPPPPGAAPPADAGRGRGARGGAPATPPPEPIPQHCRVKLTLKPSTDSNIYSELWMPTDNWNGKLLVVGNGGFAGSIQGYGDMQIALRLGYATAATDTGHNAADGPNGMFALGHPEKIVDFAYRAVHETTVESKRLVKAYYDRAAQYSYFKGCSTGGRQAVMAAQRFPDDYDGIIAGALANRHIHMHTAGAARQIVLARHPDMAISQEKAQMVNDAVMRTCDTLREGFLNNPQQCTFSFSSLLCKGAESNECLTPSQLKAVEMFYGGLKNSNGEVIFAGQAMGNPLPPLRSSSDLNVIDTVRIWAFQNPDYDWRTFDLDRDMPIIDRKIGFVDATDPDLQKFKVRGGKLLLYAGWADTGITPINTVEYYDSVMKKMGKANTSDFARLFMVPGMGHCRGGDGPDTFDTIGALEEWREKGTAPAVIAATNRNSGLSRPLCAYPQYANYKGTGDLKDAANWVCTAP
jgi:pimeloyl-ACP methyl ester carboxylesterase